MSTSLYSENFESGPGVWTTGKDQPDGGWHGNVFGQRGGPTPLGWSATGGRTGGFAFAESPWYFDDNHGQFAWLYLMFFVNRSEQAGLGRVDLRGATIDLVLRGEDLDAKDARLRGLKLPSPLIASSLRATRIALPGSGPRVR